MLGCDWRRNFFKNGDGFSQSRLVFLAKQCVPSPPNNISVSVLFLKRNIQNVAAGFALLTVVKTSRFIG